MKKLALLLLCLTLGIGGAWASIGSTNPADFPTDYVDWCQFGCGQGVYTTPQAWISVGTGYTGLVGNTNAMDWHNLQQSTSWAGNFPTNMGLVYNGVSSIGTSPTTIGIYFDNAVFGAGAYIQADWFGPFTASITLLDSNLSPFFTYYANGNSTIVPNTALFIGAYDGTADIWGVIFDTTANGFHDQDFAIGDLRIGSPVPEPSTLLLLAPSVLGLGGILRRRLTRSL
jgi:hypothetical protein